MTSTNRCVGLTFGPQDRCTFTTHHNAMMLLPRRSSRCPNQTTYGLEKSSRVRHIIDHECGERFVQIQLNDFDGALSDVAFSWKDLAANSVLGESLGHR